LADLIAFNEAKADEELAYFGQEVFYAAEAKGPLTDSDYLDTLAQVQLRSRDEGLDAAFAASGVDVIVAPNGGPAAALDLVYGEAGRGPWAGGLSAASGYPNLTMPLTYIHGLPVAISFLGPAWSEPTLLRVAYAFEQAVQPRRAPQLLASTTPPTPWGGEDRGGCAYLPIAGRDAAIAGSGGGATGATDPYGASGAHGATGAGARPHQRPSVSLDYERPERLEDRH
jgi:hypothetical protein